MNSAYFSISMLAVFIAVTSVAAETAKPFSTKNLSPAERAERRERDLRMSGGSIVKPGTMQGRVAFINSQKRVPVGVLAEEVAQMSRRTRFNIRVEEGDAADPATASERLKQNGANFGIFIVDDEKSPMMLLAPEERWAIVNVAKLTADNPTPVMSLSRLKKESMRAFAYLCGGAASQYKDSIVGAVAKPSDLDNITESTLPVDTVARTYQYLRAFGVTRAVHADYIVACEQGWAPAPTNDYQKAIWDRFQQKPTKGMEIKYDPKRGK